MDYDDAADPLAYDIAFWMQAFDDPEHDPHVLGDLALELGPKLRALGIYGLLATGEGRHLHENLTRSGELRLRHLQRLPPERLPDDHHGVLGRIDPLLDLIAANRDDLVRRLLELSSSDFDERREYLDDHCYARALATLFLASDDTDADAGTVREALERFERWLDGDVDPRLDLCHALLERDRAAFVDAFEALLARRVETIEARRDTDLDDAVIVAERLVFVEGLALLTLARRRSLDAGGPYALCPSSALAAA